MRALRAAARLKEHQHVLAAQLAGLVHPQHLPPRLLLQARVGQETGDRVGFREALLAQHIEARPGCRGDHHHLLAARLDALDSLLHQPGLARAADAAQQRHAIARAEHMPHRRLLAGVEPVRAIKDRPRIAQRPAAAPSLAGEVHEPLLLGQHFSVVAWPSIRRTPCFWNSGSISSGKAPPMQRSIAVMARSVLRHDAVACELMADGEGHGLIAPCSPASDSSLPGPLDGLGDLPALPPA